MRNRDLENFSGMNRWFFQCFGRVILFWLALPASIVAQEAIVTAELEPNPAGAEDQVTLTVTVAGASGSVERPQLPHLAGLKLVSGPNTSTQFQWINGQSSSSQSFSYVFFPEKEGTVKIPAITVRVGGKSYQTRDLSLQVIKGSAGTGTRQRRGPASIFDDMDDPFGALTRRQIPRGEALVTSDLDKKSVYAGEQVILTYRLLTQVPVAQVEMRENPSLKGFWVEEVELPKNPQPQTRTVNGKQYVEYVIKKQALFPTESGNLEISPALYALVVKDESGGFFSLGTQETVLRKTPLLHLAATPLPERGRPADFTGAVGDFKLEAAVDKKEVAAGDAVTLKVTLTGAGNLKTISDFPLPEIPGFKLFSSKSNDNVRMEGDHLQGSKNWDFVIVPQAPGQETVPELRFSYFSPTSRQFEILHTSPIPVAVSKGTGGEVAGEFNSAVLQQGIIKRRSDIHYIQVTPGISDHRSRMLYQAAWIYPLALAPWLFCLAMFAWQVYQVRQRRDERGFRSRQAGRLAEKQLSEASKCLKAGQKDQFHAILEGCLIRYLGEKFNWPIIDLTSTQVRRFFEENGKGELGSRIAELLEECSFARYAPGNAEISQLELLLGKARKTIVEVEKVSLARL